LRERKKGREGEEEEVKSYWMILRERKVTGICKGRQYIVLSGELAVE
jgi:hypothetical protein